MFLFCKNTVCVLDLKTGPVSLCNYIASPKGSSVGVRGQAGEWAPGPSAPETPVPPAAAAGHSPDPPASCAAERAPSDAAPPAARIQKDGKSNSVTTAWLALLH